MMGCALTQTHSPRFQDKRRQVKTGDYFLSFLRSSGLASDFSAAAA
jgi:hypothetical protein